MTQTLFVEAPFTRQTIDSLHEGDSILLSGIIYTARDAAHKRFTELLRAGKALPVDLRGQALYYCGPTPPRPGRPIGSAGPTTSGRMDAYTPLLLQKTGLAATIGKGSRSPAVVDALRHQGSLYLAATGGAGALYAQCIVSASVVCYEDLGPEAVFRLEVKKMPLIVAVAPGFHA